MLSRPTASPPTLAAETPMTSSDSNQGGGPPKAEASPGLVAEFVDFLLHNKLWWMTPIAIVLAVLIGFILYAESSPVIPFIYTVQ